MNEQVIELLRLVDELGLEVVSVEVEEEYE